MADNMQYFRLAKFDNVLQGLKRGNLGSNYYALFVGTLS